MQLTMKAMVCAALCRLLDKSNNVPSQAVTFRELFANSAMRPYLVRRVRCLHQGLTTKVWRVTGAFQ